MKFQSMRLTKWCSFALLLSITLISACGNNTNNSGGNDAADAAASGNSGSKELTKVTSVSNWFAQAEHGGLYAAKEKGYYADAGLDLTISPGGPQVSATQIVASGKAQFGMAQADEILLARQNGIPLVTVFASFQTNPQGIMVHHNQNITSAEGLNNREVYVNSGAVYWEYLKKAYKLDNTKVMAYTGSLAPFLANDTTAIQGYVTSEPYEMKQQNVDVDFLLNANSGYNPYANVLFTTESYAKDHQDIVKAYVEATVKGFNYYKDNYEEINVIIQKENPDIKLDSMKYASEAMNPLVFGGDAVDNGAGYMTQERWEKLADQMTEIGILTSKPDVSKAFTTEFLPKP